ncbi:hypothetical protein QOZ96_003468 [Brevundimonas nasdae]|uniref:hypothetical protein n=1 Tax=Brevundimonas nasdae TaxID=172043 RepID=UPI0019121356|nr:hypothetical protein [Brevundimonas nasdae]MBK6026756.1 hypothetical protein [Brevundimonas nasdae]MDQ0453495.1 hypothetical protein [Brevundimonas nasdae]
MLVEQVRFVGHAEDADVSVEPVDFGVPMRIVYVLDGWRRGTPLIRAYAEIDGERGEKILDYATVEAEAPGRWAAQILNRRISLTATAPGGDLMIEP